MAPLLTTNGLLVAPAAEVAPFRLSVPPVIRNTAGEIVDVANCQGTAAGFDDACAAADLAGAADGIIGGGIIGHDVGHHDCWTGW